MECSFRFNPKYGMLYGSEKPLSTVGSQLTRVWTRAMLFQTCSDVHGFHTAQTVTNYASISCASFPFSPVENDFRPVYCRSIDSDRSHTLPLLLCVCLSRTALSLNEIGKTHSGSLFKGRTEERESLRERPNERRENIYNQSLADSRSLGVFNADLITTPALKPPPYISFPHHFTEAERNMLGIMYRQTIIIAKKKLSHCGAD